MAITRSLDPGSKTARGSTTSLILKQSKRNSKRTSSRSTKRRSLLQRARSTTRTSITILRQTRISMISTLNQTARRMISSSFSKGTKVPSSQSAANVSFPSPGLLTLRLSHVVSLAIKPTRKSKGTSSNNLSTDRLQATA